MAFVDSNTPADPNNPNNPLNPNGQPAGQGANLNNNNQPATTAGAGPVTATGAANVTGQVTGTNAPAQPFQNIASYLAANAPQSQQLAGQVASTVANPINQANTDVTNAANSFTSSVDSGFTPTNNALISAVAANPNAVVQENPQNVTNFTGQLADKYTGPTDFTQAPGYTNLESEIANAQALAANTNSTAGIQSLLQGVEGPTTAGINTLDTVLLNTPQNIQTLQNSAQGASDLAPTLTNTTTAENAAAAQGSTTAANTATAAQKALTTAQANEAANLTNEQNTITGIVNEYNQSVNTISPVVADIASSISNFLKANPNVSFQSGTDPLAALENLASITMPQEAAYASPQDYAQIAALLQLGDTNASTLPINSTTANEAQTFNVPTQLQDALGKAPGVEAALQGELNTFGGQINSAATEFQNAEEQAYDAGTLVPQQNAAQVVVNKDKQALLTLTPTGRNGVVSSPDPVKLAATQKQLATDQAALDAVTNQINAEAAKLGVPESQWAQWGDVGKLAQSLQWVNPTETNYQDLVNAINTDLGKLGAVGAPTLTYGPNTVTDPVTGVPIGQVAANQIGKSLAESAPTGAVAGGQAFYNAAQIAGAGGGNIATGDLGEGLATSGAPGAAQDLTVAPSEELGAGIQAGGMTALETVPLAAAAAYGTQNIETNAQNNPYRVGNLNSIASTGLEVFGNMGTLGLLSLPPQIFQSIGKDITNVLDDIGHFFGGLF